MKKTAFYLETDGDDILFHIPNLTEDRNMNRAETFLAAVFILWTSDEEHDEELVDRLIAMASNKTTEIH